MGTHKNSVSPAFKCVTFPMLIDIFFRGGGGTRNKETKYGGRIPNFFTKVKLESKILYVCNETVELSFSNKIK